ncbi:MAG: NAD(P)-binding protein [Oligoflexales bacterium]
MSTHFDVIIAGAGLSGAMLASRLKLSSPEKTVLLIDKDPFAGGRVRTTDSEASRWDFGFNYLSERTTRFFDQLLKASPDGQDLYQFGPVALEQIGSIAANKLSTFSFSDMFGVSSAYAVAGPAAKREWAKVESFFEGLGKDQEKPFAKAWELPRKSGASLVLENLLTFWGVPDVWATSAELVAAKVGKAREPFYSGQWSNALDQLLTQAKDIGNFATEFGNIIVSAKYEDDLWHISTQKGDYTTSTLAIAHPPWDLQTWLEKKQIPNPVLVVASKAKPASALILSEKITSEIKDPIPGVTFIPSEGVHVVYDGYKDLCYRIALDYEVTYEAPTVTKAVRSIKRAKKRFHGVFESLTTQEGPFILVPAGWAVPWTHSDRKWAAKFSEPNFQNSHLVFVGDTYGDSPNGDENTINSILSACETIGIQS